MARQLFRTKALERASSPDALDQIIEIVSPKDWLPLVVLGALLVVALVWGVTGRVPTTVTGRGMLVYPRRVVDVQALGAGRVEMVLVKTGDAVKTGDVIARVDQYDLRKRLNDDRGLLAELMTQDRTQSAVQIERERLQKQQTVLDDTYIKSQTDSLKKALADAQTMAPTLKRRLDGLLAGKERGLIAPLAPELIEAEQAYIDNTARIADVTAKLKELDRQANISASLEKTLTGENLESNNARRIQIQEISARIALNEQDLEQHSQIVSNRTGRVLEVFAHDGQIITVGSRVATIEGDGPTDTLMTVSYFAVGDGKRVKVGDEVQVTPDTTERQRYGGIIGVVKSVSAFPVTVEGARALIGNSEVVEGLLQGGPRIEVIAELRPANNISGFAWSSSKGPDMRITAGLTGAMRVTVERRAPISYVLPFLKELTGV